MKGQLPYLLAGWKVVEVPIVSAGSFLCHQFGHCWRCPKGPSSHLAANIGRFITEMGELMIDGFSWTGIERGVVVSYN